MNNERNIFMNFRAEHSSLKIAVSEVEIACQYLYALTITKINSVLIFDIEFQISFGEQSYEQKWF